MLEKCFHFGILQIFIPRVYFLKYWDAEKPVSVSEWIQYLVETELEFSISLKHWQVAQTDPDL